MEAAKTPSRGKERTSVKVEYISFVRSLCRSSCDEFVRSRCLLFIARQKKRNAPLKRGKARFLLAFCRARSRGALARAGQSKKYRQALRASPFSSIRIHRARSKGKRKKARGVAAAPVRSAAVFPHVSAHTYCADTAALTHRATPAARWLRPLVGPPSAVLPVCALGQLAWIPSRPPSPETATLPQKRRWRFCSPDEFRVSFRGQKKKQTAIRRRARPLTRARPSAALKNGAEKKEVAHCQII
jgi:hypothetical protein